VRDFAQKRIGDFRLDKKRKPWLRNFGVTPKDGIRLRVVKVHLRGEFAKFEEENPCVDYLLTVENTTADLQLTDQPTRMKGYLVFKPALSHQSTRLVQMCLRNSHGVAFLFNPGDSDRLIHGQEVRIISDGVSNLIEDDSGGI